MDLPVSLESYADHVAPRLLHAPAELVIDAIGELSEDAVVVELDAGAGALSQPLGRALAEGGARLLTLGASPDRLAAFEGPAPLRGRIAARGDRLPFADSSVDVIAANLWLGQRLEDEQRLREVARVLRPGGRLVTSVLLRGSFEELFDILTEVCEQEGLSRVRGALTDARGELYGSSELGPLLRTAGLKLDVVGEEQRALWFAGGDQVVEDPLLWDGLVAAWLSETPIPARARQQIARFVDTYFESARFPVRVRTAVVVAIAPEG
jgi:SAM-dependent methyltransferase